MSAHDLYADDFPPHGTTRGYAAGCHSGGACPGKLERGQTCVQANQRYASDYGYRKAVDRGEELAFLTVSRVVEAAKPKARRKPRAPKPVDPDLDQWPDDVTPSVPWPPAYDVAPEVDDAPDEPIAEPELEPEAVPEPDQEPVEQPTIDESPRPRGKQLLDDALRTLAEAAELQRAIADIAERAIRTARIEINHMRREIAEQQSNDESSTS